MATRRLSVGRRNLLERLAHSRAADDLREIGRQLGTGIIAWCVLAGAWVTVTWIVEVGIPAVCRWLGWI